MSPEKLIKYLIPFFAFAIVSRSIEAISFFYYAVPLMCALFIGIMFNARRSKSDDQSSLSNSHSGDVEQRETSPESAGTFESDSRSTLAADRHTSFAEMTVKSNKSFRRRLESGLGKRSDSLFASLKRITSLLLFLIPGLWFLLTYLWSSYPIISAERAVYFILLSAGCVSAGILWTDLNKKNLIGFFLPVNVFVVLLCLFSLITNIPSNSWTGGNGKGFMGFFGQQNLLASIILFTLPSVVYQIVILAGSGIRSGSTSDSRRTSFAGMTEKSDLSLRRSPESKVASHYLLLTSYFLLLASNLLLLLLTYSRASILSVIIGAFVYLILNKNWKVITYSFGAIVIIAILILLISPLKNFSDSIIKKDFPEYYSSRMWMWEPSYHAALNGGVIGLGYGISDPNIKPGNLGDHYEGERFVREKGNSSLALIEETGLIGLILFILPIIYLLIKLPDTRSRIPDKDYKSGIPNLPAGRQGPASDSQHPVSDILFASLAAFIIHSQFEAWWVGVGSVQLPLFFVYLGLANINRVIQPK